jgi:hypothetical protein
MLAVLSPESKIAGTNSFIVIATRPRGLTHSVHCQRLCRPALHCSSEIPEIISLIREKVYFGSRLLGPTVLNPSQPSTSWQERVAQEACPLHGGQEVKTEGERKDWGPNTPFKSVLL